MKIYMNIKPYEHLVQYYETDKMQVVHHSNYIRWFEEARTYMLNELQLPYEKLEEMGIIIPVLSVSAQYKSMVRYGETALINIKADSFNGIKMFFSYEVTDKKSGRLCAAGTTSHCFLGRDMKPINLKKSFPDIYDIFSSIIMCVNS